LGANGTSFCLVIWALMRWVLHSIAAESLAMELIMRIHQWFIAAAFGALVVAAPANAQSIKKVGSTVHKTLKKTGNEIKEVGGDVGSATHKTLTKAGKDTKNEVKRTTGGVKVGGDVGKAANAVSRTGKKAGRHAKKSVKKTSSAAHNELTETGKNAKEAVKKP
jgi:uncharacterized protein YoxC